MTTEQSVFKRITEIVLEEAKKHNTVPWRRSWSSDGYKPLVPLRANGIPFTGINKQTLRVCGQIKGYENPTWVTYRQAEELGGHVKAGEKGSPSVFLMTVNIHKKDDAGQTIQDEIERTIKKTRGYTVFNVEQTVGLPDKFYQIERVLEPPIEEQYKAFEDFCNNTGAIIRHGGDRAFYSKTHDFIQMPHRSSFQSQKDYLTTKAHELGHWTMPPHRLDRNFGQKRFGDIAYAMEEIVAEMTAGDLSDSVGGFLGETLPDHTCYIVDYFKLLEQDETALFRAAAHAERASKYLWSLQPQPTPAPEIEAKKNSELKNGGSHAIPTL